MKPVMMRTLVILSCAFVAGAGPTLVLNGLPGLGFGPWAIPGSELLLVPGIVALPGAIVAALLIPIRRVRRACALLGGALAVLAIGTFLAMATAGRLRMWSFHRVADRARPLVLALARYQAETKKPPAHFSDVVPRYLPAMPRGLPPLELVSGHEAEEMYRGNPWVLRAGVGIGFLNWDQFLYFPRQDYPAEGYGGPIERVADWAYVHE